MKVGDKVKLIPSKTSNYHFWQKHYNDIFTGKVFTVKKMNKSVLCPDSHLIHLEENDYIFKEESLEIVYDDFLSEKEFSI